MISSKSASTKERKEVGKRVKSGDLKHEVVIAGLVYYLALRCQTMRLQSCSGLSGSVPRPRQPKWSRLGIG